ncbi:MAG: ATP synthase subunit I [Clostridia bacterium]|nr:ATP synthase subunit I [Clostridia bacterium]
MKKIEPTIIKETLYILVCVVILSAIMESVFLIIHRWDYTVLLGNLLTGFVVTLNFFLMGLGVQKSLEKDEKEAKKVIRLSQIYRYLILIVFLVIGVVFSCFNNWAVFIPVVFPRIAVAI